MTDIADAIQRIRSVLQASDAQYSHSADYARVVQKVKCCMGTVAAHRFDAAPITPIQAPKESIQEPYVVETHHGYGSIEYMARVLVPQKKETKSKLMALVASLAASSAAVAVTDHVKSVYFTSIQNNPLLGEPCVPYSDKLTSANVAGIGAIMVGSSILYKKASNPLVKFEEWLDLQKRNLNDALSGIADIVKTSHLVLVRAEEDESESELSVDKMNTLALYIETTVRRLEEILQNIPAKEISARTGVQNALKQAQKVLQYAPDQGIFHGYNNSMMLVNVLQLACSAVVDNSSYAMNPKTRKYNKIIQMRAKQLCDALLVANIGGCEANYSTIIETMLEYEVNDSRQEINADYMWIMSGPFRVLAEWFGPVDDTKHDIYIKMLGAAVARFRLTCDTLAVGREYTTIRNMNTDEYILLPDFYVGRVPNYDPAYNTTTAADDVAQSFFSRMKRVAKTVFGSYDLRYIAPDQIPCDVSASALNVQCKMYKRGENASSFISRVQDAKTDKDIADGDVLECSSFRAIVTGERSRKIKVTLQTGSSSNTILCTIPTLIEWNYRFKDIDKVFKGTLDVDNTLAAIVAESLNMSSLRLLSMRVPEQKYNGAPQVPEDQSWGPNVDSALVSQTKDAMKFLNKCLDYSKSTDIQSWNSLYRDPIALDVANKFFSDKVVDIYSNETILSMLQSYNVMQYVVGYTTHSKHLVGTFSRAMALSLNLKDVAEVMELYATYYKVTIDDMVYTRLDQLLTAISDSSDDDGKKQKIQDAMYSNAQTLLDIARIISSSLKECAELIRHSDDDTQSVNVYNARAKACRDRYARLYKNGSEKYTQAFQKAVDDTYGRLRLQQVQHIIKGSVNIHDLFNRCRRVEANKKLSSKDPNKKVISLPAMIMDIDSLPCGADYTLCVSCSTLAYIMLGNTSGYAPSSTDSKETFEKLGYPSMLANENTIGARARKLEQTLYKTSKTAPYVLDVNAETRSLLAYKTLFSSTVQDMNLSVHTQESTDWVDRFLFCAEQFQRLNSIMKGMQISYTTGDKQMSGARKTFYAQLSSFMDTEDAVFRQFFFQDTAEANDAINDIGRLFLDSFKTLVMLAQCATSNFSMYDRDAMGTFMPQEMARMAEVTVLCGYNVQTTTAILDAARRISHEVPRTKVHVDADQQVREFDNQSTLRQLEEAIQRADSNTKEGDVLLMVARHLPRATTITKNMVVKSRVPETETVQEKAENDRLEKIIEDYVRTKEDVEDLYRHTIFQPYLNGGVHTVYDFLVDGNEIMRVRLVTASASAVKRINKEHTTFWSMLSEDVKNLIPTTVLTAIAHSTAISLVAMSSAVCPLAGVLAYSAFLCSSYVVAAWGLGVRAMSKHGAKAVFKEYFGARKKTLTGKTLRIGMTTLYLLLPSVGLVESMYFSITTPKYAYAMYSKIYGTFFRLFTSLYKRLFDVSMGVVSYIPVVGKLAETLSTMWAPAAVSSLLAIATCVENGIKTAGYQLTIQTAGFAAGVSRFWSSLYRGLKWISVAYVAVSAYLAVNDYYVGIEAPEMKAFMAREMEPFLQYRMQQLADQYRLSHPAMADTMVDPNNPFYVSSIQRETLRRELLGMKHMEHINDWVQYVLDKADLMAHVVNTTNTEGVWGKAAVGLQTLGHKFLGYVTSDKIDTGLLGMDLQSPEWFSSEMFQARLLSVTKDMYRYTRSRGIFMKPDTMYAYESSSQLGEMAVDLYGKLNESDVAAQAKAYMAGRADVIKHIADTTVQMLANISGMSALNDKLSPGAEAVTELVNNTSVVLASVIGTTIAGAVAARTHDISRKIMGADAHMRDTYVNAVRMAHDISLGFTLSVTGATLLLQKFGIAGNMMTSFLIETARNMLRPENMVDGITGAKDEVEATVIIITSVTILVVLGVAKYTGMDIKDVSERIVQNIKNTAHLDQVGFLDIKKPFTGTRKTPQMAALEPPKPLSTNNTPKSMVEDEPIYGPAGNFRFRELRGNLKLSDLFQVKFYDYIDPESELAFRLKRFVSTMPDVMSKQYTMDCIKICSDQNTDIERSFVAILHPRMIGRIQKDTSGTVEVNYAKDDEILGVATFREGTHPSITYCVSVEDAQDLMERSQDMEVLRANYSPEYIETVLSVKSIYDKYMNEYMTTGTLDPLLFPIIPVLGDQNDTEEDKADKIKKLILMNTFGHIVQPHNGGSRVQEIGPMFELMSLYVARIKALSKDQIADYFSKRERKLDDVDYKTFSQNGHAYGVNSYKTIGNLGKLLMLASIKRCTEMAADRSVGNETEDPEDGPDMRENSANKRSRKTPSARGRDREHEDAGDQVSCAIYLESLVAPYQWYKSLGFLPLAFIKATSLPLYLPEWVGETEDDEGAFMRRFNTPMMARIYTVDGQFNINDDLREIENTQVNKYEEQYRIGSTPVIQTPHKNLPVQRSKKSKKGSRRR